MKGPGRLLVFVAIAGGVVAACIQQVDGGAALDPAANAPGGSANLADATTWQICQSPSCDDPSGAIPYLVQTPPVFLPDGGTTVDPCVDVEALSVSVRQTYCARCHGPATGAGQGGFNYVLDDDALAKNTTSSATFPSYVVPGSPYTSFLYVRVANGTMPPPSVPGGPQNPVPTASDLSILYGWIQACVAGPGSGYVQGGGWYGPGYGDADASEAGGDAASGEDAGDDGGGGE